MNIEGIIPIVGGVLIILVVQGVIPKNPRDPQKLAAWRKKFGPTIKILGPIVIVFGLLQLLGVLD